jgi:O-antigen ligase
LSLFSYYQKWSDLLLNEINCNLIKKDKKNTIVFFLSFIYLLILFFATNLPSPVVMPTLNILGISILNFVLLIGIIISISISFAYQQNLKLNSADFILYCYFFFMMTNVLIVDGNLGEFIFYVITILSPYFIGRALGFFITGEAIIKIITMTGLIQIILVLYSYFVQPFDFTVIQGRDLFGSFNSKTGNEFLNERASGTLGHPVVLGNYLTIPALVWFFMFIKEVNGKKRTLYIVLTLICLFCIFLTYSRGTWFILLLLYIFIALKTRFLKSLRGIIVVISALIIYFLSPANEYIMNRLLLTTKNDGSVSHRLYMYYWSLKELFESPKSFFLGKGVGNIHQRLVENPPPDFFLVLDNNYLLILVELGIVGLLLMLTILIKSISFHKIYSREVKVNSLIIIAIMINGLTYEFFDWEQISVLFWILVGINITKKSVSIINEGERKI